MNEVVVAVLATLDSKGEAARFVCDALPQAGVRPWLVDISLRPHANASAANVQADSLAEAAGTTWEALAEMDRAGASEAMIAGGVKVLQESHASGAFAGVVGLGGANGTAMACSMMRALPLLVPKAMVSAVAATAAVQWYVAESDIVMFPSIGDLSLNRITGGVLKNAARAVAAMALVHSQEEAKAEAPPPLIGVSSFGGTAGCVDRVTERLAAEGYEVIHFHASGPGGRALESLARLGELAGVVDVTTHELTDHLVGGVYSAGAARLTAAGRAGLPQVVVPGALDHANFWVGQIPERHKDRAFFQYNAQNILMRTDAKESEALGRLVAERLNEARGPFAVLIPRRGFSEHTKRRTHGLDGRKIGPWNQPEVDARFAAALKRHLESGRVEELDLHVNDPEFADACVDAFLDMIRD